MDVLLLSLFTCTLLCEGLHLCITIYIHPAAALLSTSGNGSLSIQLSGLGTECVVLIRAVLWTLLSEWVGTWRWIITVVTIWEKHCSHMVTSKLWTYLIYCLYPLCVEEDWLLGFLCMCIRTDLGFYFLCNCTPWIINSYYLLICRGSFLCL